MLKSIEEFIEGLASMKVTPNVHNQYSYEWKENATRRKNLSIYLNEMSQLNPKILLVGEAPGYRGCRLTGVPFTSEHLLMNNIGKLTLFGEEKGYKLAKDKEKLLKETTATIIWSTLLEHDIMALSWNAFPFHPYKKGNTQSNRTPLKKEIVMGQGPLMEIIKIFSIEQVVAVGNKAKESLDHLGIDAIKVRHPAHGGKSEFVEGIKRIKEMI